MRARHIIDAQEIDHAVMNSVVDNPDWGGMSEITAKITAENTNPLWV